MADAIRPVALPTSPFHEAAPSVALVEEGPAEHYAQDNDQTASSLPHLAPRQLHDFQRHRQNLKLKLQTVYNATIPKPRPLEHDQSTSAGLITSSAAVPLLCCFHRPKAGAGSDRTHRSQA